MPTACLGRKTYFGENSLCIFSLYLIPIIFVLKKNSMLGILNVRHLLEMVLYWKTVTEEENVSNFLQCGLI